MDTLNAVNLNTETEVDTLTKEAESLFARAKGILVTNPEEYQAAGREYAAIKAQIKQVEAERIKRTGPINESLKLINADFKRITEVLQAALRPYEQGMLAFKQEEDRKHREAEEAAWKERERLEAEARAVAQAEMERLEKAKKEAEEATKKAEVATSPVEAYLARQQAAQAEQEAAEARQATENALREAAMAPRAVSVATAPRAMAAGTSYRTKWTFKVTDLNLVPRQYLIINEQMIGAIARTAKGTQQIPGIEFLEEKTIGGR